MLLRWWQGYLSHHQGTHIWLAGNHKVPTNKFDSLLHFAPPNVFIKAGLLEHSTWFKATPPILHLQANLRCLTLKCNTCLGRVCMLTCVSERLSHNSEERRFNPCRQAL